MGINDAMYLLIDELAAGDVPAPLTQSLSIATLWADLCRLAGEFPPAAVVALIDGPPEGQMPLRGVEPDEMAAINFEYMLANDPGAVEVDDRS